MLRSGVQRKRHARRLSDKFGQRGSTSPIPNKTDGAEKALAGIPASLRAELLGSLNEVIRNFREGRWEAAVLNAGKLCEVVHTILRGHADGHYPDHPSKPPNMVEACRKLEHADPTRMDRVLRIQIPRALIPLYEMRNNRGVGHVGGDVDPNHMDAVYALVASKWIVADLVRAYHGTDTTTATSIVEALIDREVPLIWQINGVKRVLDPRMGAEDRVLLLLYGSVAPVPEDQLRHWVNYANTSRFRSAVLRKLHREVMIHYDDEKRTAVLSPIGKGHVEENLLPLGVLTT